MPCMFVCQEMHYVCPFVFLVCILLFLLYMIFIWVVLTLKYTPLQGKTRHLATLQR